jgi:hypothetical protein
MLPFLVPSQSARAGNMVRPAQADLDRHQGQANAWLAEPMRANRKLFRGIPIHFVDAPKSAV